MIQTRRRKMIFGLITRIENEVGMVRRGKLDAAKKQGKR